MQTAPSAIIFLTLKRSIKKPTKNWTMPVVIIKMLTETEISDLSAWKASAIGSIKN